MKKYTNEEFQALDVIEMYNLILKDDKITKFSNEYWSQTNSKKNAILCIRYLIEEVLKYDDNMIKEKVSTKLFKEYKLFNMISICFDDCIYEAINSAYPNKFKEWEIKSISTKYWDFKPNAIKATKFLIEEKLELSSEELKNQLSSKLFIDNGLKTMLRKCFNNSPYEAINSIYPNKFKEWEFKQVPKGYWKNKNNGIRATKWLIEEKLSLSSEELKDKLSYQLFKDHGLKGMLQHCFNYSPYEAVNSVYPNKYKAWEFKSVSKGYWSVEKGIEATRWMIEEKLKLTNEDIYQQLSANLFKDNGLSGMLKYCFNNSPYEAINTTYPNTFDKSKFKTYK